MEERTPPITPSPTEAVLVGLVQELVDDELQPERIIIERATPDHYMVRIYPVDSEEYVPYQVRLDAEA